MAITTRRTELMPLLPRSGSQYFSLIARVCATIWLRSFQGPYIRKSITYKKI